MDFSFNSKLWAGNIYHHFESICNDVEGFVNKDSVKFVENQVQSVGLSVKRLYSNVVNDILPLSTEILKPERQLAQISQHLREQENATVQNSEDNISAEKIVTEDLKRATADSSFDSDFFSGKLDKEDLSPSSLREQGNATVQNSEHSSNAEKNVTEDLKRATADSSFDSEFFSGKLDKEDISSSNFQEKGNATVQNSEGSSNAEKNITEDLKRATADSSFDSEFFLGNLDKEYISSSPAFSAHEECSTFSEKERRDLSHQEEDDALQTDRSEFEVGSFESSGHEEHHQNVHLKISISPSETQNTNGLGVLIGDLDLETVELFSNVKHDGRTVDLNSNVVVPGSYRRKNFRYYKGACTSQKRLSKEYEHLAIMYGDIDVEANMYFESASLSPFPKMALHSVETRNEIEWELL